MEIVRSHVHRNISTNDAVNTLPLYRSAPPLEVRLEDFELYAMDRLRVLKGISDGLSRGKKPEEMDPLVKSYIYDHVTIGFSKHTGHLPWNILYAGKKSMENAYEASTSI